MSDNPLGMLTGLLGGDKGNILGSVMKMVSGGGGAQAPQQAAQAAQAAQPQGGGTFGDIGGLIDQFQNSGLVDKVQSWIGQGDNEPISAQDVQKAMTPDQVKQVAAEAGVSERQAADGIAEVLPQAVDKMTPQGKFDIGDITGMIGNFLGGK